MLKALGMCFRLVVFSVVILILGNWLRWDGQTISDQVRLRMSHAEETGWIDTVRNWAEKITHDARKGSLKKANQASVQEEIPSSERQKLKALIRELNGSQKKD